MFSSIKGTSKWSLKFFLKLVVFWLLNFIVEFLNDSVPSCPINFYFQLSKAISCIYFHWVLIMFYLMLLKILIHLWYLWHFLAFCWHTYIYRYLYVYAHIHIHIYKYIYKLYIQHTCIHTIFFLWIVIISTSLFYPLSSWTVNLSFPWVFLKTFVPWRHFIEYLP